MTLWISHCLNMDTLKTVRANGNSKKRGRKPLLFANGERHVDFWLGLGIMFMPYVFAWFTLRDGHTKKQELFHLFGLDF